jgi:hypothetical protein
LQIAALNPAKTRTLVTAISLSWCLVIAVGAGGYRGAMFLQVVGNRSDLSRGVQPHCGYKCGNHFAAVTDISNWRCLLFDKRIGFG